jgi:hypothetical protein
LAIEKATMVFIPRVRSLLSPSATVRSIVRAAKCATSRERRRLSRSTRLCGDWVAVERATIVFIPPRSIASFAERQRPFDCARSQVRDVS